MSQTKAAITPQQIKVREVTHYQWSWTEQGPGSAGTWTTQLVLDEGAEEYVLRPTVDDADVLQDLLAHGERVYFDLERKVLMFGVKSLH